MPTGRDDPPRSSDQQAENHEERLGLAEVTRRALMLPISERLELFETLRADLADTVPTVLSEDDETNRRLRRQREALSAIRTAAAHLRLPAGVAPTPDQFDRAAAELGCRGRWRRSRARSSAGGSPVTYLGRVTPETPARRRARRKQGGGGRCQEQFVGLRLRLDEPRTTEEIAPPPTTTSPSRTTPSWGRVGGGWCKPRRSARGTR